MIAKAVKIHDHTEPRVCEYSARTGQLYTLSVIHRVQCGAAVGLVDDADKVSISI